MMNPVIARTDDQISQRSVRPCEVRVLQSENPVHDQIDCDECVRTDAEEVEGDEQEGGADDLVDEVRAEARRDGERLLRMMHAVKGPQDTVRMNAAMPRVRK